MLSSFGTQSGWAGSPLKGKGEGGDSNRPTNYNLKKSARVGFKDREQFQKGGENRMKISEPGGIKQTFLMSFPSIKDGGIRVTTAREEGETPMGDE